MKLSIPLYVLFALLLHIVMPAASGASEAPNGLLDPANTPVESLSGSSPVTRFFTEGEWYFSWGYSTETWAPSDIHISQPTQNSDFTIHDVKGHDEPGWTSGILNKGLFAPQNNIRVGRFIDEDHTLAIELSLDHTKYTSTINQTARVTGTVNGIKTDADKVLDERYFRYDLHNGANHLMLNLVKRVPLFGITNESASLAAIGKAGIGVMVPHSDNTVMGQNNDVGSKQFSNFFGTKHGWWQLDGVTAGIEAGLRFVLFKPFYLEFTDKVAYARLFDIPVYQGKADQSLWMNEVILTLGFTYDGSKKPGKR